MFRICLLVLMVLMGKGFAQELVGSYDTPDYVRGIAFMNTYAYVADEGLLMIFDISIPALPAVVKSYSMPGKAIDVTIYKDHLYVLDLSGGLLVYDVSNSPLLTLIGSYDTPDQSLAMTITDDNAYIADSDSLLIVNISNPRIPVRIGSYNVQDRVQSIVVVGNYAYIAGFSKGLQILDITNPALPEYIGGYSGFIDDIAIDGDYAYIAANYEGIQILDISNPASPERITSLGMQSTINDIEISGTFMFMSSGSAGFLIIDISNPSTPRIVGRYRKKTSPYIYSYATGVTLHDDYAYVAYGSEGFCVLDIVDFAYALSVNMNAAHNTAQVEFELSRVLPPHADSICFIMGYGSYPETSGDPYAKLLGVCSVSDSSVAFRTDVCPDSIYYISVFAQDSSGSLNEPPIARTIGMMIYDYSHDSLIVSDILRLNNVQNRTVSDVADTINGAVYSLDMNNLGLCSIPGCISDLYTLAYLSLSNNALVTLPGEVLKFDTLRSLDLSGNNLALSGAVKNWALTYDNDYQQHQDSLQNSLLINNSSYNHFENGCLYKSVLVIEPKGSFVENSIFLKYTDNGNLSWDNWDFVALEVNHFFELPESAVVTDLWLWMGDSVMQAKMYDVSTANAIYDSIVSAPTRIDPAILKKDGNHYELSIYPYHSGGVAQVKITYITLANVKGDTVITQVPIPMLDLNNNFVKPLSILFKERAGVVGRVPSLLEAPGVAFEHNRDTLGYRYLAAQVDDITYFPELSIVYTADTLDTDTATGSLMQANRNIHNLFAQEPVDTAAIVDSSIHYNILTDFTALLALEPDATNHYLVEPLEEGDFVDPLDEPDPRPTSIDDTHDNLLESIGFKIDPNPFTTHTNISFTLEQASQVRFDIFSPAGVLLKNIHSGEMPAGLSTLKWDGRTGTGASLEKGTYIYRIEVDGKTACGKVMKF